MMAMTTCDVLLYFLLLFVTLLVVLFENNVQFSLNDYDYSLVGM